LVKPGPVSETAQEKRRSIEPLPGLEQASVLLVEDHPVNRRLAMGMLQKLGAKPECATSGPEAIKKVQEKDYDIILMDIRLPGMSGLDATQQIRRIEEAKKRKTLESRSWIIALTAHTMKEVQEECFQAGVDDYLGKPFTMSQLRDVLQKALQRKGKDGSGDSKASEYRADLYGRKTVFPKLEALWQEAGAEAEIKMAEDFLHELSLQLNNLTQLQKLEQWEEFLNAIRSFKNLCKKFELNELLSICHSLEQRVKERDLGEIDNTLRTLVDAVGRVAHGMMNWIEQRRRG